MPVLTLMPSQNGTKTVQKPDTEMPVAFLGPSSIKMHGGKVENCLEVQPVKTRNSVPNS